MPIPTSLMACQSMKVHNSTKYLLNYLQYMNLTVKRVASSRRTSYTWENGTTNHFVIPLWSWERATPACSDRSCSHWRWKPWTAPCLLRASSPPLLVFGEFLSLRSFERPVIPRPTLSERTSAAQEASWMMAKHLAQPKIKLSLRHEAT